MSLINNLFAVFGFGKKQEEELEDMFRYPMVDKGVPYKSLDVLLKSQKKLIADIRIQSGVEDEIWEQMCLPTIRNYAAFVHLLPASENHHHRGFGGLFRHGLEVAYWSLLKQEAIVLGERDLTPSEKHARVNDWRLAAFVSGLCHDLGKPMIDIAVSTPVGEWNPHSKFLFDFLKENNVSRYHVTWRPNRGRNDHEAFAPMAIRSVVDPALWEYFCRDYRHRKSDIPNEILKAISGKVDEEDTLADIVKKADQASVTRDLLQYGKSSSVDAFNSSTSLPFDWFIINAIKDLISDEDIPVNKPGSYIWSLHNLSGEHVVALNWSKAYDEIKRRLPDVVAQSIPSDKDRTAEILIERNAAMTGDNGGLYARLRPQAIANQAKKGLSFLLFDPDVVYSSRIIYNPMPCVELDKDEAIVENAVTQEDVDAVIPEEVAHNIEQQPNKVHEDVKTDTTVAIVTAKATQLPVSDEIVQAPDAIQSSNGNTPLVASQSKKSSEALSANANKPKSNKPTLSKEKQKLKDAFDELGLIHVRHHIIDKSDYWVSVLHPQAVNDLAAAKGVKGTQIISLLSEAGAMSTPMLINRDDLGRGYIKLAFNSSWFEADTVMVKKQQEPSSTQENEPIVDISKPKESQKKPPRKPSKEQDSKPTNAVNDSEKQSDEMLKNMTRDEIMKLLFEELDAGVLQGTIVNEASSGVLTLMKTVNKLESLGISFEELKQNKSFTLKSGKLFYTPQAV